MTKVTNFNSFFVNCDCDDTRFLLENFPDKVPHWILKKRFAKQGFEDDLELYQQIKEMIEMSFPLSEQGLCNYPTPLFFANPKINIF